MSKQAKPTAAPLVDVKADLEGAQVIDPRRKLLEHQFGDACKGAVLAEEEAKRAFASCWYEPGQIACALYGEGDAGFAAIREAKEDVVSRFIVPAMLPAMQHAITRTDIVHARSKDYAKWCASLPGGEEEAKEMQEARTRANRDKSTYFDRLCAQAYPAQFEALKKENAAKRAAAAKQDGEGDEGEGAADKLTATEHAQKYLPALKKKVGEDEAPAYDPMKVKKLIEALMAEFSKPAK